LTSILQGVVERGTGKSAQRIGRPVAAKTGTSQAAEDLWFLGYTPSLVAGLWLGYDQPRSIGGHETAGKLAAPIWVDFMKRSLAESQIETFSPPEGVFQTLVNRKTGEPTSSSDPEAFLEYFIRHHEGPPAPPTTATLSHTGFRSPEVGGDAARPQPLTP